MAGRFSWETFFICHSMVYTEFFSLPSINSSYLRTTDATKKGNRQCFVAMQGQHDTLVYNRRRIKNSFSMLMKKLKIVFFSYIEMLQCTVLRTMCVCVWNHIILRICVILSPCSPCIVVERVCCVCNHGIFSLTISTTTKALIHKRGKTFSSNQKATSESHPFSLPIYIYV